MSLLTLLALFLSPVSAGERAAPEMLEPPFTADQIRDNFPLGTELLWSVSDAGTKTGQRWTVTKAHAEGGTFSFQPLEADMKTPKGEATEQEFTWTDLRSHAIFPKDGTAVTEETIVVPAGTFTVRRYRMTRSQDGGELIHTFDFDLSQPGPPVRIDSSTAAGGTASGQELVARRKPDSGPASKK